MPREAIITDKAPKPGGHFAQAIAVEATGSWCSSPAWSRNGLTARSPASATSRRRRGSLRERQGSGGGRRRHVANVCRVDVYVRNMEIWRRSIRCGAILPVAAAGLHAGRGEQVHSPDYLIEMSAIAAV